MSFCQSIHVHRKFTLRNNKVFHGIVFHFCFMSWFPFTPNWLKWLLINAISHEITLNLTSFPLKITKNVEDCHSPISSFAQMLSSEIMSTLNSRKFCSQPFSICLMSCFFFQSSVPYYFILIFSSTLVNSFSSHWMELLWTCSSSTKSCWSSYFKKSSKAFHT